MSTNIHRKRVFMELAKTPCDIKDDTSKFFDEIHSTSKELRCQMVEIAQHSFIRTKPRDWANHLRFLEVDPTSHSPLNGIKCPLALADSGYPLSLALAPRREWTQAIDYVAISYCWQRPFISWFLEQNLPTVPVFKGGKPVNQPVVTDVLYRASRYALKKGVDRIWIDQYCIDQDDPVDKQEGIQAMDVVYQHSSNPVALLETYIESQEGIDAFAVLFTGEDTGLPDQIVWLADVLEQLSQDAWFRRAWTLQEATSAGVKMGLLIACNSSLEKPEVFGSTPGEIEFGTWDLQNAMVFARNLMELFLDTGVVEDKATIVQISNLADDLLNYLPEIYPELSNPELPQRQTCNAAEAVNCLQERQNSVFSDRLAILANMCDYEIRIDTSILESSRYSFSTCVITLAILNGDATLLGEYSDPYHGPYLARDGRTQIGFKNNVCDSTTVNYGFSWGPHPQRRLRDVEYYNQHQDQFQLRPSLLSEQGLRVRGVLWRATHKIPVKKTQAAFAAKYAELEARERDNVRVTMDDNLTQPLTKAFAWCLIRELIEHDWLDIAHTLWTYYQPRKLRSREPHPVYDFAALFLSPRNLDDRDIISNIKEINMYVNPEFEDFKQPSTGRIIIDQVCNHGTLTCASPLGTVTPRVFFESYGLGDLIFTPLTAIGDRASTASIFEDQAMSWKVQQTGASADQCDILHCLGRRRGIYRMENLEARDYILD